MMQRAFPAFCLMHLLFLSGCMPYRVSQFKTAYSTSEQIKRTFAQCFDGTDPNSCERAAWELAYIGDYDAALLAWDLAGKKAYAPKADSMIDLARMTLQPALPHIFAQAKNHQVVMINEDHHSPHHRVFTTELLDSLYVLGFRSLGLEGLKVDVVSGNIDQIPGKGYLIEPQYANLLRHALNLGYYVFGYDNVYGRGKDRELNQVNEIIRHMAVNHNQKTLIHSGGGHIREDTLILGGLMGYQFKKKTGIDPLTINQARFSEHLQKTKEHFLYRDLPPFAAPSMWVNRATGAPYTDGITDLLVLHPRTRFQDGRVSYLYDNPRYLKKKIKLPKSISPALICTYFYTESGQYEGHTPVDIIADCKNPKKEFVVLTPFKGRYISIVFDAEMNVVHHVKFRSL